MVWGLDMRFFGRKQQKKKLDRGSGGMAVLNPSAKRVLGEALPMARRVHGSGGAGGAAASPKRNSGFDCEALQVPM